MSILSRFNRAVRLPSRSNLHSLSAHTSGARRSHSNIYASGYSGYGDGASDGVHSLGRLHVWGCGPCPYASGLRAMHWISSSNHKNLGYHKGSTRKSIEYNYKAVSMVRNRSYSGVPTLWTLIGANVGVFAMWHMLDIEFMRRNFMVSVDNLMRWRFHTLLTSAFSHLSLDHLIFNLIGLYCFGSTIGRVFGEHNLFLLYLGGALAGSMGHLFYTGIVYPFLQKIPLQSFDYRRAPAGLGASGAVSTLVMLHIFLFPTSTIFVMFIPMPAAVAGCVLIGLDVYQGLKGKSDVSVGAHFGGAFLAVLLYMMLRLR